MRNDMKTDEKSLKDVSELMRDIDFCMLTTVGENGMLHSRPMSNNRNVQYEGDNYFFSYENKDVCSEIKKSTAVSVSFSVPDEMTFVSIGGRAELVHDKSLMKKYWVDELEEYFPKGLDEPGIVLIKVSAQIITIWENNEEHVIHPVK
jgi:general stress protein 26